MAGWHPQAGWTLVLFSDGEFYFRRLPGDTPSGLKLGRKLDGWHLTRGSALSLFGNGEFCFRLLLGDTPSGSNPGGDQQMGST